MDNNRKQRFLAGTRELTSDRYNATEDLPADLQKLITAEIGSPERDKQLDKAYDQYIEQEPVSGYYNNLKRMLGSKLWSGGNQQ